MTTKVRKQIYLDRDQELYLEQLSFASGMSEAEIILRTLNLRFGIPAQPPRDLSAWEEEKRFIQEWIAQSPIAGGRTWKREDLYD